MQFRRLRGQENSLQYSLIVISSDGSTDTFIVDDSAVTIGRSPSATVCLNEEAVSRQHCVITSSAGRLMLLDQGSTNGTKVNGEKVQRAKLSHGDVVQVGTTRIRVRAHTGGGPSRAPEERQPVSTVRSPLPHEQLALLKRLVARLVICRTRESAATAISEVSLELFPARYAVVLERARAAPAGSERVLSAVSAAGKGQDEEFKLNREIVQRVVVTGEAARYLGPERETLPAFTSPFHRDWSEEDDERLDPSRQVLCAPIRCCSETLGVIYLEGREMPDWVGSGDCIGVLTTLGDLAALFLRSAGQRNDDRAARLDSDLESGRGGDIRVTPRRRFGDDGLEAPIEIREHLDELRELTAEQRSAVEELKLNLERHVEARAVVIEEQRIELAARLGELEHLERARATMSHGLVHDIRNLVGALQANLAYLKLSATEGSEESSAIEAALVCAKRITSMAEDVLSVARMEQGTFPLELRPVSVNRLLSEAITRHSARAREAGVDLRLGRGLRHLQVLADPEVLARILDNLIENGLRYAREGFVELRASVDRQLAQLIVVDSGPGVAPQNREKIFGEWVQADGGTGGRHHGFGLYFCRLAAEAHGGSIRVEGGSGDNRFVVSLPSTDDHQPGLATTEIKGGRGAVGP